MRAHSGTVTQPGTSTLAERAQPSCGRREARAWLERLDSRASEPAERRSSTFSTCGDADGALRLSGAIWLYWQTRGHWTEGRRFLRRRARARRRRRPARLVNAFWGGAFLALWQGDVDEGEELADRLLDISRQAGLEHGKSSAIHVLAIVALQRGERDRARTLNEEALAIARQLSDDWLVSVRTNNLGDLLMEEGEFERAAGLFEESLAIGEARGDLDRRARALVNLGYATHSLGDNARAHELLPWRSDGRGGDRPRRGSALGAARRGRI